MNRIYPRLVLLAVALLPALATGCTMTSAGEPRPGDTATEATDESGQSSTSEEPPDRPREIKLDGIDPCTLIPESDYPKFYMDEPGQLKHDDTFNAAECAWDGTDIGYFSIVLITTEGIEGWLDGSKRAEAEEAEPISGFRTLTINNPGEEHACFAAVDVAEGQQLSVQVGLDSEPTDIPPICEYTHQFAASAMSTLVGS